MFKIKMWEHKIFHSYHEVEEFLNSLNPTVSVEAKIIKSHKAYVVFYQNLYKTKD